ncbi:ABC-2 family transporter protein [Caviibacter abscessus]|uniref:ABC-2 family transporter protein n=1 Tax=Caviibacter abscessus TaxID=1766719 RepID=UPI00082E615A|nr:ABC-2 family transporter protein [Caviibacter abscessus]
MRFKVFIRLVKNSVKESLAYRTSSVIMFIVVFLFFLLQILANFIFYKYTNSIAGYTLFDSINLINTATLITHLNYSLFIIGNESIYYELIEGEMDYKFLRPINSYWLYAFYGFDIQSFITFLLHAIFQIYLFSLQKVTALKISAYILMVILGSFYIFLILRALVLLVFYTDKANSIQGIPELLEDAASRPKGIYPKFIRYIFIYFISYLMVYNGPIDVLKGNINYSYLLGYIISLLLFLIITYKLWFIAIKKYQSSN